MRFMTVKTTYNEHGAILPPTFDGIFDSRDNAIRRIEGCVSSVLDKSPSNGRRTWNEVCGKYCKMRWDIIEVNDDLGFARNYSANECNDRGVPFHVYRITTDDGHDFEVDVAVEEEWGDVQRVNALIGNDHIDAVGYGNDETGIRRIEFVADLDGRSKWTGDEEVRKWYYERVAVYGENYCG